MGKKVISEESDFFRILFSKWAHVLLDIEDGMIVRDLYKNFKIKRRNIYPPQYIFKVTSFLEKNVFLKREKKKNLYILFLTLKGLKMKEYLRNIEEILLKNGE